MQPRPSRTGDMKKINYFSHQHPLRLYKIDDNSSPGWEKSACHLCGQTFKFRIFGCKECRFFIHDSCAELPQQLNHPFHPQHAICLYDVAANNASEMFQCDACGEFFSNFMYHCAECKFNLDLHCQELTPTGIHEDADSDEEFYCYACEEVSDPDILLTTARSPFIAHIDCVVSEILLCIERDSSGAVKKVGKVGLSRSANNFIDSVTFPKDSGQTTSTDVPTEETNEKVGAQEEEMVKKSVIAPDENVNKRRVAAIDAEIAALQTKILQKQFLQWSVQQRIKHLV